MQIEINQLNKSFTQDKQILKDISFSVQKGEVVSILGPSGCGKSTILRVLAGLETQNSGTAVCNGEISFVFQQPLLLDWRSALANVTMPLEIKGEDKEKSLLKAKEALTLTGLGDSLNLYPEELSGGMKMRVSLARALVTNPEIMLLDEPFAALDEMTREMLNEELIELNHEKELTLLLVTHNIFEAVYMSDRIIILSDSPAEIVKIIDVNLPKPREMKERGSSEFAAIVGEVQNILRSGK
ncbi:MAG: ABC transporter ATP-binding protein [Lentisphaeraceae bacterium]|nr:ABC transporter ATP-binding protein [Lentisphaeraceae bacterium]